MQSQDLGSKYGELLGCLLSNRGIKTIDEAERFLNPDFERDLHDPFLILNMEKAVERILRAVSGGEKIIVYGDYDCDGIPGSVILHDFLKKIGYENFYVYIPHRHLEGYGLNIAAIKKFATDGAKLLITVDNGIADVDEVSRANELGLDVIITDHHLPQAELPKAYAILNSKQKDDSYPFDMLCGAGVAFKLVQALLKRGKDLWQVKDGWERWLLDMAGLSTIADMVPLHGENRALAHFGLKVLRRSPRPGLMKLLAKARVDQRALSEEDVGFTIAPRINAASRMGEPIHGFHLLAETDEVRASVAAGYLEAKNNERKRAVEKMMKEIERRMAENEGESAVIVIGDKSFAPGVVGLAAGRIAERHKRPAFVWGGTEVSPAAGGMNELKGSCRSDGRVNIVELMAAVGSGVFTGMGGHALAGGFSVREENLVGLAQKLSDCYLKLTGGNLDTPRPNKGETLVADKKIFLDDVTEENCALIEKMSPFGVGNRRPVFLLEDLPIQAVNFFGANRDHLKLEFKSGLGEPISAVLFRYKDKTDGNLMPGDEINLLAHMERDNFSSRARLRVIDLR